MNFSDAKILKVIKEGTHGIVYRVRFGKEKEEFAMKIWKIKKSEFHSELKFYETLNTLTDFEKKFFMKVYGYEVYDNCTYENKFSSDSDLSKSTRCCRALFELIDGTIMKLMTNKKAYLSILVQLLYACTILEKYNFFHGSLHYDNIGFVKTDEKILRLEFNSKVYEVETFGYQLKVIDYGNMIILKKSNKFSYTRWIFDLVNFPYFVSDIITKFTNEIGDDEYFNDDQVAIRLKNTMEYKLVKKYYHKFNDLSIFRVIMVTHITAYYQIAFGKYFHKYDEKLPFGTIFFINKIDTLNVMELLIKRDFENAVKVLLENMK